MFVILTPTRTCINNNNWRKSTLTEPDTLYVQCPSFYATMLINFWKYNLLYSIFYSFYLRLQYKPMENSYVLLTRVGAIISCFYPFNNVNKLLKI